LALFWPFPGSGFPGPGKYSKDVYIPDQAGTGCHGKYGTDIAPGIYPSIIETAAALK